MGDKVQSIETAAHTYGADIIAIAETKQKPLQYQWIWKMEKQRKKK